MSDEKPYFTCPNCGNEGRKRGGQAITGTKVGVAFLDAMRPTKAQRAKGAWQHMQVARLELHCTTCGHDFMVQETWDDTNGIRHGPLEPQYLPPPPPTEEEQARRDLGTNLRHRRGALDLSMKELADKAGTTAVVISHLEHGMPAREGEPNAHDIAAVLTALEASAAQ